MKASKSAVFLFELMVIILVFTIAAAVCAQIFASAFAMSKESRNLTMSSINAQTVAERFKAGDMGVSSLYFDSEWHATDEAGAHYTVSLDEQEGAPQMREAYVNVYEKDAATAIFSLHVKEFAG